MWGGGLKKIKIEEVREFLVFIILIYVLVKEFNF